VITTNDENTHLVKKKRGFFLSSDLVNNITTFILGLQDLHETNSKT
ncbi:unnamed protein product, partial [Brassica oleracea]